MLCEDIYNIILQNVRSITVIGNVRLSSKLLLDATKYVRKLATTVVLIHLFDKNDKPFFPKLEEVKNIIIFGGVNEETSVKDSITLLERLIKNGLKVLNILYINDLFRFDVNVLDVLYPYSLLINEVESLSVSFADTTTGEKYTKSRKKCKKLYHLQRQNNNVMKIKILHKHATRTIVKLIDELKIFSNITSFSLVVNAYVAFAAILKDTQCNISSFIINNNKTHICYLLSCIEDLTSMRTIEFSKTGLLFLNYIYAPTSHPCFNLNHITNVIVIKDSTNNNLDDTTLEKIMLDVFPNSKLQIKHSVDL